jgi:CheY-like chemotaxis protein
MERINILLIEDNEGDIILTQESLSESKIKNKIFIVKDGDEALKFLGSIKDATALPDIIIMDWNLPKVHGREVLSRIKNDQKLKSIPVLVFTTTPSNSEILDVYEHRANCCISKPSNFRDYVNVIKTIEDFWLNRVRLPIKKYQ